MKRPTLLAPALLIPAAASAQAPAEAPSLDPPPAAVQSITGREIAGHLRFLASDLLRGREAGTADARLAAEYLASNLTAIGAEPMGETGRDGKRSYFQRFMLEAATPQAEGAALTLTITYGQSRRKIACALGSDYAYGPTGVVVGEIDAPAIFVGFGRVDAEKGVDDYAGKFAKGSFVLAYRGDPGENAAKVRAAAERGALGVLLIAPPGGSPPPTPSPRDLGFGRPRVTLGPAPAEIPAFTLAAPIGESLAAALGLTAPDVSPPEADRNTKLGVHFAHAVRREPREDRNVVGFFPGSDPEKAKEVVVFSAHYDHEGVDEKGEIYNGSDDNGSGTSGILEVAQAFAAAPRPARSVLFLWVSGEEKGLLGSKWFADHPTLPEGSRIVADINLDMISRNDPAKIGATPSPSLPDYNTLVVDAAEATRAEGLEMLFDTDPFYGRTDSYNFAAKGVPVIFFFAGLHEDYHKPTDDVEKADVEKAARVARAAFRLGWKAAQAPEAPKKVRARP
ncbi:MAG: hypothetical protein BGO49_15410 [Planctomycetales bacterium 71-10]|nr:MAG: hypothetical protein BGO49_15410 [Planctomycetales bacterium 71-10]